MFDNETLTGILSKEDVSVDEKIALIISEHEADKRGLIEKNQQLIGAEKKLKEQISAYGESEKSYSDKIANLEKELKSNSAESHREYYDAQLKLKQDEFDSKMNAITAERDYFKSSHLKRLQDDAIAEGIKDITFIGDAQRKGFVNIVLAENHFEAKEIDGQTMFLNRENKTIAEVMQTYASTTEGKSFIKNPTTGGGARGDTTTSGKMTKSRADFERMTPTEKSEFFRAGGKLI